MTRTTILKAVLIIVATTLGFSTASASLVWSTFVGGGSVDYGAAVAIAGNGDGILLGTASSADYPTTPGVIQRSCAGDRDAVLTRLSPDGHTVIWSTYLGGSAADNGLAVAVGPDGDIYVAGMTASSNFPVTAGALRTTYSGGTSDVFVARISPDGRSLRYCTYLGGSLGDLGLAVAVDGQGCAFVAGYTASTDFPTTAGVVKTTRSGGFFDAADGFVAKLSPAGNALVYSTYVGSDSGTDEVMGMALDGSGRATVTGMTQSPDFPVTPGAMSGAFGAYWDGFVARLNESGSAFVYSTALPGSGYDEPSAVALDPLGRALVTGRTTSSNFPTSPGAAQRTSAGGYDAFAIALSSDGSRLEFGTFIGGAGDDQGAAIVALSSGEACVAGYTAASDFPTTPEGFGMTLNGAQDAFLCRISADGSTFKYSTCLGSSNPDLGRGLAQRPDGTVLLTGYTASSSFPVTSGAFDMTHNSPGTYDAFLSVLDVGVTAALAVHEPDAARVRFEGPFPNPCRGSTTFSITLPAASRVTARVVDLQGRLVETLVDGQGSEGTSSWTWTRRDRSGRVADPGVYFVDVSVGGERLPMRKLVVLN